MAKLAIVRLIRERGFSIIFSLLISLGLLLPTSVNAASSEMSWIKAYVHGGSTDRANATAVDTHGNVLVGGYTYNRKRSKTPSGAFLRKYNSTGRLLWKRSLGNDFIDIKGIATAKNDFIYVVGTKYSSTGKLNGFVRKYGKNSGILWTRNIGTQALGVAVYKNRVYVVGDTDRALRGQIFRGRFDAFIRKYSARARVLWTRQFGTSGGAGASNLAVDKLGYVYVTGAQADSKSGVRFDNFLRKFGPRGNLRWTRLFGSVAMGESMGDEDVSVDSKRDVLVTGNVDLIRPDTDTLFGSKVRGLTGKFTPGGKLKWHHSSTEYYGMASAIDSRKNIYIVGHREIPTGNRAFASKFSRTGKRHWRDRVVPNGVAKDVAIGEDGSLYVVGNTDDGNWFLAKY